MGGGGVWVCGCVGGGGGGGGGGVGTTFLSSHCLIGKGVGGTQDPGVHDWILITITLAFRCVPLTLLFVIFHPPGPST